MEYPQPLWVERSLEENHGLSRDPLAIREKPVFEEE